MLPLVAATWVDAFRRVCNRIALVAAAICAAAAPLSSFAAAKEAILKATGYSGSTTLTDFQALVKLSNNDAYGFSYDDCAASDGSDLWFEDANGNLIPHEVDKWNTSGDSYVWVKIPSLTRDTQIVMHWGATRTQAQTCTPSDTWSGYVGVWHMNATGQTAEPDSTGHGLNAAPLNTSSSGVSFNANAGIVGSGRANSDATDGRYFSVGSDSNPYYSTITTKANFSVSGWWKLSSIPSGNGYQRLICGMSSGSLHSWDVWRENGSNIGVRSGDGSNNSSSTGYGVAIAAGDTWHYLTVVWEGNKARVYKNGSRINEQTLRSNTHPNNVFTIGGRVGTGTRSFVGTFDEVRMYDGVLSADRVAADYATMNAPTEFLVPASQPTATWTGAAGDGNPATASNWNYYEGSETPIAKVPDSETIVTIAGNSVNLQIPANSTFACKSFEIRDCTFTADCDWRGLSVTPVIIGTANLDGHVLKLNNLSAVSGSAFSGGDGSFVEFVVDESATIANLYEHTYIENVGNLAFSGSANIRLRKKDGNGTLTVTRLELGNQRNVDMVQTNGTVSLGGAVNAIGENSGKTAKYTMSGGSLNVAGGSEFIVGSYGTGVFNQSGGAVTLNEWFSLGRHGGTGTYTMTGGSLTANHTGRPLWIGADNGTGTLTIGPGATATFKGGIDNGRNNGANSKGYLNLNGGTLTVSRGDGFNIGRDGTGTLVQNGGILTANEGGIGAGLGNVWRIAWGSGGTGSYTLNDGTAIAKSTFFIGDGGTATYTQNGGTMTAENGVQLAYASTAKTTFTLSGGVFYTKHIQKGSGSVSATFDGGTIVATNVTNGANFITGLNNVKYGPGGLTLDTAGYDVTMATASGANVLASAGSTFTKTGSGTLTVAAVPPVGNMAVSSGTLALSASCDNASMLAHRWSFASDLTDSVTGTAGTMSGSGATYADGVVKLPGGNKGTCYIDLGANKLPSDSVTIEAWFTLRSQVDWTRVFVIGGSIVFNSRRADNGNACNFDSLNGTQIVNTSGKVLAKDTPYYVAVTFTPDGNGGVIEKQYVKKVGDSGFIWNNTVTKANWSVTANAAQGYFWLGHSNGNDKDTNIDFDEVRVWSGALDDTAIALSVEKGADATAADIAEIAATTTTLPLKRTIEIASGATLNLGGNTLTQPVLKGNGTIATGAGGSLVVSDKIVVNVGEYIEASGTIDLSNAKIELADPENLATAFTFLKPATGQTLTVTGVPTPVNLPKRWKVSVSADGTCRIGKRGFIILVK